MVGIRPKLLANEICKPANQSDFTCSLLATTLVDRTFKSLTSETEDTPDSTIWNI